MNEKAGSGRHGKNMLPLNEDDIAQAFGDSEPESEEREPREHDGGFFRLFVTIILAVPVAAFLTLVVIDLYQPLAEKIGLRDTHVSDLSGAGVKKPGKDDNFATLVASMEKTNKSLAAAMNRQADAIRKLADKGPGSIKVEIPPIKFPPFPKAGKSASQKIVVVKVPSREKFDLAYEKRKILELSGVDLDDPVPSKSRMFRNVKSRDVLKEVIRSLDDIIAGARDYDEVTDYLKANALKAKKHATKRLSKLR